LTYRIPYVVLIVHVKIEQHFNTYRILRIITSIFYKGSDFSHKHQVRNLKQLVSIFYSVVAVAFQITFRAEIYVNNFFYFLKIIFNINTLKQSKTYKSY
jgi:hypothetical protein